MAAGFTNVDPVAFAQGRLGDLNQLADQGNITAISRAINGGDHGLQARIDNYNKILKLLGTG
jgi:predicted chitinase